MGKSRILKNKDNQITQKYKKGVHDGIDDVAYKSDFDYITAHSAGEVVSVRKDYNKTDSSGNSYGNYVKIKHANGYYTLYAHLKYNSVTVKVGDKVSQGQVIGYMGATGHCTGAHVHFEVRNTSDVRIDPTPYIDSDLPSSSTIKYQTHDKIKNKWLPNVSKGTNEYAGNFGNEIDGLYIDNIEYRVHDKIKNYWLPWVNGRKDYAGNLGNDIDGLQVKNATYRVHIKGGEWLSWISKVDDTNQGYAGILGKEIDAIQIK